jgi:hypothetical protein
MKPLTRLERALGGLAIPDLTVYLVFAQTITFVFCFSRQDFAAKLMLEPALVLQGEYWRLFTFAIMPPMTNPIFAFFALYFFYMMGTALEAEWGEFRYNLYLLIAYLMTIAAAFGGYYLGHGDPNSPSAAATNAFIGGSVFLAFAWLYPDYKILLFFILPVAVKWLALAQVIFSVLALLSGGWVTRMVVLASYVNFLLFFGVEVFQWLMPGTHRAMKKATKATKDAAAPAFHTCAICGKTDKTHPTLEFRYCPECTGTPAYCMEHFVGHTHR